MHKYAKVVTVIILSFVLAAPVFAEEKKQGKKGFVARMDTNQNQRIERDEWRAVYEERFDKIDTNKDGVLERSEFEATIKKRRSVKTRQIIHAK